LQNELGNTLVVAQNGPFQFATPEALNDQYELSVFTFPSTQSEGCTLWNYKGVVIANVTTMIVVCAHNDWTWIDGKNIAGTVASPLYGAFPTSAPTPGTAPPNPYTNSPGGRYGAAGWTDKFGNLWMFGGDGWELSGNPSPDTLDAPMNDLWVCIATGDYCQWQLVGGYGATGPAIQTNVQHEGQPGAYPGAPGGRYGAATWTDNSGNLWMFGGYGFDGTGTEGYLNDLWEYTGGKWNFVSGTAVANQNGIYGTAGTAATTNMPGGRHEAVGWADASGNLWLFGGEGDDSVGTANGILNDLWVYNIANKEWTFVMGSPTANQTGEYGLAPLVGPPTTTGAAGTYGLTGGSAGTLPGSRWGAAGWSDSGGNFWLFGGWGLDSTATNVNGALNDLWVYTPNATAGQPGTWTWIKGSNTGSDNGVYGDELRPYKTYEIWTPGGRSNATHWVDGQGQLWLFGGEGYDSTSTTGNGYLNDMWRYLPYPN
jgi:hypothetical protein